MTRLDPIHPGEVLKHDFMDPLGLSATALATAIGVTPARISEIVRGRRRITADTALRLTRYFGTDARSWMNLQHRYELLVTARENADAPCHTPARSGLSAVDPAGPFCVSAHLRSCGHRHPAQSVVPGVDPPASGGLRRPAS